MREKKVLTEETLKVVEDVRERRIEELFRKFDYDYDGLIKVEEDGSLDVTDLNTDEIALLTPIICKIEQKKLFVDFNKFKRMLNKVFKRMNVDQRNRLMGPPKREAKVPHQESSFKPRINKQSEELARTYRKLRYT